MKYWNDETKTLQDTPVVKVNETPEHEETPVEEPENAEKPKRNKK